MATFTICFQAEPWLLVGHLLLTSGTTSKKLEQWPLAGCTLARRGST